MRKTALIILDGWGIGDGGHSDAIAHSRTPFMNHLLANYPHSQLLTDGENVGLPGGQMGNSEVGHLNIGAGRIVYQDLVRINIAVRKKEFHNNPVLLEALRDARDNNKNVHLMGLLSDGGVHSHINHLKALCECAKENGIARVFIHAFMDGRDCDPKSGIRHMENLLGFLETNPAKVATINGRYYAMDRDKRWERIKAAYDMLINGTGNKFTDPMEAIRSSYTKGVTDEFIKPVVIMANGKPLATIRQDDVVICFNFRTDRCRQITRVLTQEDMPQHGMKTIPLHYITMTDYDHTFRNIKYIYRKEELNNTIGEILSNSGITQIRIAETEKYPHVTYFFSGGREVPFEGEKRILIPSPKVSTYDLKPEMSAIEVTDAVVPELISGTAGFVCLNFANSDMVGHTGVFPAVVRAVETVDGCLKRVVEAGLEGGYSFFILADHGNADYMINPDGTPNTAHSLNPVPSILIDDRFVRIDKGILADVAPTLLTIMGMKIPAEMSGKVLIA